MVVRGANGQLGIVWALVPWGAIISAAAGIGVGLINKSISKKEQAAAEAFAEAEIAAARASIEAARAKKTLMYVGVAGAVAIMLMKG